MSMDPIPEWRKFCKIIQELIENAEKDVDFIKLANALPKDAPKRDYEEIRHIYEQRSNHFVPLLNMRDRHCRVEYPFP